MSQILGVGHPSMEIPQRAVKENPFGNYGGRYLDILAKHEAMVISRKYTEMPQQSGGWHRR